MSGMREIRFEINKQTGEMTTETVGFKGKTCEDVLNKLSEEMKTKVLDKKNKPEKYQPLSDAEAQKEKQKLLKK